MLNIRREFIVASLLVCAGLASVLGSADPGTQAPVATRIFRVESPTSEGMPYTVLSTADGRVYTVDPANDQLVQSLLELSADDSSRVPVQLSLVGDEIVAVMPLSASDAANYKDKVSDLPSETLAAEVDGTAPVAEPALVPAPVPAPARAAEIPLPYPIAEFVKSQNYYPTILNSVAEAQRLFDEERNLSHDSQCHERAMVWSHDMFKSRGIKSMKVMMFYTLKFRTTFSNKEKHWYGDKTKIYKWWYHTAPVVYVKDASGIQPYVLDREFLDRAVTLNDWSYHFMVTEVIGGENENIPSSTNKLKLSPEQATCQLIANFREFAIPNLMNQVTSNMPWCQMRIFPMYYMQPGNIAMMDCEEGKDADYTRGLTGYGWRNGPNGIRALDQLNDGRYKWACSHSIQTDFFKGDLKTAYKEASERAADSRTGR